MSGLPNVLTMCLNTLSLSFHSEDHSNILEFLSATTFSDPGMWAAETDTCRSAAHCHMSKAISSYKLDLIPPPYIINISYCCIVVQYDPNMFKSSRALMCNACSCLVDMPPDSDFLQIAKSKLLCKEPIMTPKKVICCFGNIFGLSNLM